MRDPWDESTLAERFRHHSELAFPRAPLNAVLCAIIARDRSLAGLLGHAPPTQQTPVLLLAAIHFLLLDAPDEPLARWYRSLTEDPRAPDDEALAPTLSRFISDRGPEIVELLATRRTQTNEVGRCASFLPALELVAGEVGPLAHLDVGSSAGLTTLLPHFSYRYDDGPLIGEDTTTRIELTCSTRGAAPLDLSSLRIPPVVAACGIDSRPVDVTDPNEARWIEACCWPDQVDRFRRLRAAIGVAREHPPELLAGDAVESVAPAVDRLASRGHPVVTTSWMLNYLVPDQRRAFVDRLEEAGRSLDLSWLIAEAPIQTPELPHADDQAGEEITALTLVTWRDGRRTVRHLGTCHPHGYWIHWR